MIAAAGIGALGSVIGGLFGGGGAKKAARIQQQTTREQIAANERNRAELTALSQPAIDRGNAAGSTYAGLLGIGGDPAASAAALGTWRGSTGYQDLLDTGLRSVNSNAYARGMGDSGATLRALQRTGANIANQNQQQYLSNLGMLMQSGNSAIGNVAGVATNTVNANNQALQAGADASGNAAIIGSANTQNMIRNLANVGMSQVQGGAFGSSYAGSGTASIGLPSPIDFGLSSGGALDSVLGPPRSSPGYGGGYIPWGAPGGGSYRGQR